MSKTVFAVVVLFYCIYYDGQMGWESCIHTPQFGCSLPYLIADDASSFEMIEIAPFYSPGGF